MVDKSVKEDTLKVNEQYRYAVNIHKQGVIITKEFKADIGKVRRKDGTILNVPSLVFKQHIDVDK